MINQLAIVEFADAYAAIASATNHRLAHRGLDGCVRWALYLQSWHYETVYQSESRHGTRARQILLYRALGWPEPHWAHAPLVVDAQGRRLAKRTAGLSIRELRAQGRTPAEVLTAPVGTLLA